MAAGSKSHTKTMVRLATGREIPELLRDLYVDRRYTQEEISRHIGVSRDTVVIWLKEYGISRADRQPLEPVL